MLFQIRNSGFIASLFVFAAIPGFAAPVNSKLLSLVPERAQIVTGIEDPHSPTSQGRLLLVTRSSNLDFDDWIALTGVDSHQRADEVIEVAASCAEGKLHEHLMLVAGQFDHERICRAALENGASITEYRGLGVLVVKPFAREREEMPDSRWMVILDDRTAIFGIPDLVRKALDHYLNRSAPDPLLIELLSQLHSDVHSWNVLVMSVPMLARYIEPGHLCVPWTNILDGADELTLGIHYGGTDRIDFAVHAVSGQDASFIFRLLLGQSIAKVELCAGKRLRLKNLSNEQNRVRGSFLVSRNEFDKWITSVYNQRSAASNPQRKP